MGDSLLDVVDGLQPRTVAGEEAGKINNPDLTRKRKKKGRMAALSRPDTLEAAEADGEDQQ